MTKIGDLIPGDAPYGIYLKGDRATYRGLRNAFNAAQASWRSFSETQESLQSNELGAANASAWGALAAACETCLSETSKDLEVLSWYVAAQLHGSNPFSSTADALTDMAKLVEGHINELQPQPPEAKLKGDSEEARASEIAELRIRPFLQLFGEVEGSGLLNAPLTNLPLVGEITYGHALLAEKDGTLDTLRTEVSEHLSSGTEALTQKIEALQAMEAAIAQLDATMKRYASQHSQTPPMVGYGKRLIVDVLQKCQLIVEGSGFVWPGEPEEEASADAAPSAEDDGGETSSAAAPTNQPQTATVGGFSATANVTTRRDALAAIAQLATYFRTSEPHSPICLLLDRAVRWGNLSAGELYREILSDGSVGMAQMALMTGLESQGFADSFGKRGAPTGQNVEHPTLDNYAGALPIPSEPVLAAPRPVSQSAQIPAVQPQPASAPSEVPPSPPQPGPSPTTPDEPSEDLPMDDFQW